LSTPVTSLRLVLALLGALWLAGCSDGPPESVALAELVTEQDRYDGEQVVVDGVVRTYHDPVHHWIEDADLNRVELFPQAEVDPHVGDRVRVTGRFRFRDDEGRRIDVDDLEVLTP
jgi:hypothetical protein